MGHSDDSGLYAPSRSLDAKSSSNAAVRTRILCSCDVWNGSSAPNPSCTCAVASVYNPCSVSAHQASSSLSPASPSPTSSDTLPEGSQNPQLNRAIALLWRSSHKSEIVVQSASTHDMTHADLRTPEVWMDSGCECAYKAFSADDRRESKAARVQGDFHKARRLFPCQRSGLPSPSSSASSSCCVVPENTTGGLQLGVIWKKNTKAHKWLVLKREESHGCSSRAMVDSDAHHGKV